MAKKRTLVNGYGKWHQHTEARAAAALKQGNKELAAYEHAQLSKPNPVGGFRVSYGQVRGH